MKENKGNLLFLRIEDVEREHRLKSRRVVGGKW